MTLAKRPTLQLEGFLPYRLSILTNRISSTIAQAYSQQFGLTIPQWRVMAVLGETAGLSANEVAQRTAMDKVAVSRAVASLEKNGRLDRKLTAKDKRRSILRLTTKGRRVYTQIIPLALAFEKKLTQSLSRSEQQQFDRLINKIMHQAENIGIG